MLKKGSTFRPPMSVAGKKICSAAWSATQALDFAHAGFQRRLERRRERDGPQPEDRMHPLLGLGDEQSGLGDANGSTEPRDKIGGEEGRIGRRGNDEAALRPIGSRPFDPGVDAGERSGMTLETIFDHRQVKRCKPRHVAIGIDDEVRDLRTQSIYDVSQHRFCGERQQTFVAAAHAARSAAS